MAQEFRTDILERGFQTFMGLNLKVARGVLIPREETELLARTACEEVHGISGLRVIDMCTGSGNLACALAARFPDAQVWAADASADCVRLTTDNVAALGLDNRVTVLESDLFAALRPLGLANSIDLVVCNPPYISSGRLESASSWLLDKEPRLAFDGGPYGLNILRRIVQDAPAFLRDGGFFAFEFGEGQHQIVHRLLESSGLYSSVRLVSDSNGTPRVAVAQKKTAGAA